MPKNILIFSDGTGQAGGIAFDEDRSNIYKLYRATRCGPDSPIDPRKQVTFYDPGLGSQAANKAIYSKIIRWVYNTVSRATGLGLTANIVDCYAEIIRLYEPGDRIFLFGFSRGAYTVRCLAGVLCLCGIPARTSETEPLKIDASGAHKLARYAVKHIYQFTEPRDRAHASERELFLLDTREALARNFRADHACDPAAFPYFIGVFDTVAALGNRFQQILGSILFMIASAAVSYVIYALAPVLPFISHFVATLPFLAVLGFFLAASAGISVYAILKTHFKLDFSINNSWKKKLATMHMTSWKQVFYDQELNENVPYAKHAISIDENRADFARVEWSFAKATRARAVRDDEHNIHFEQLWFCGNHADVGGGYPENECRLSDITLDWMLKCASTIPGGILYDPRVLKLSPSPDGWQHDEVKAGLGLLTTLTGRSWTKRERILRETDNEPLSNAAMHPSVYRRFDRRKVPIYDERRPYRPNTLRAHVDFDRYYEEGAAFPADSMDHATASSALPKDRAARTLELAARIAFPRT